MRRATASMVIYLFLMGLILLPCLLSAQFMRVNILIPPSSITKEPEWIIFPQQVDAITKVPVEEGMFGFDLIGQENMQIQLSLGNDNSARKPQDESEVQLCFRNDGYSAIDPFLHCYERNKLQTLNFPLSNQMLLILNMPGPPSHLSSRVWIKVRSKMISSQDQHQALTLRIEYN